MLPQTEALLLEDVLLDARDGLVLSKKQLWYHFQRFPWNLENPEENPKFGEHSRQVHLRISQGLPKIMDQTSCREVIILVFLPILIVIIT